MIYHFFCEATESADGLKTKQVTYSETTRLPIYLLLCMRDIIEDIFMYTGDQLYETYLENGMKVLEVLYENSPDEWGEMREVSDEVMETDVTTLVPNEYSSSSRKLYFGLRFRFKRRDTAGATKLFD